MTPGQTALVGRLRVLLAGEAGVREVSMFGAGRFGVRVFADGGAGGSAAFRLTSTGRPENDALRTMSQLPV